MTASPRSTSRHPVLFVLAFALLLLVPVVSAVAQGGPPVRTSPTQAPAAPDSFQANPTDEPDLPIRANPTNTPTPRPPVIDDVVANPTEAPREPIDDVVANPTEVPREPIDDVVANPTEAPAIDDEAIPTTGTVRVVKRDCPLGVVEDATLSDYLTICSELHNGVKFVLNDVNGAQAGVTAGGQVEWTGVDPGVFNITETVPAGYGDPIVHCGYTESPGGGVQHPALQEAGGGIVAGTFPDTMFEYVCYWMNIPVEIGLGGPDSVANPGGATGVADLLVEKRTCPNDIPPGQGVAYYIETCTQIVDGIEFTVTHDSGSSTKPITEGEATWTGLPLGPFTIQEEIPAQYGEPFVFCGWTAIHEGVAYDAFSQLIPSPGGLVEREVTIPGSFHFCYWFNVQGGPGSYADAGSLTSTLLTRKWTCPDGTPQYLDRDELVRQCQLLLDPVEFTLANVDGDQTRATSGGYAEWTGLPLGEFALEEAIPAGYGAPVVYCGWYADYGGFIYDAFPQLVILAGIVIEGEITIPNTDYFCDVFNMEGGIDDLQANPTEAPGIDDVAANPVEPGTLTVRKWDCPAGYDPLAGSAPDDCTGSLDGITFDLVNHAPGEPDFQATTGDTIAGAAIFEPQPGTYSLKEQVPDGYGTPFLWNCTGLDNPAVPEPPISTINFFRIVITSNQVIECDWMNVPAQPGLGGAGNLQANPTAVPGIDDLQGNPVTGIVRLVKRDCPAGVVEDALLSNYLTICTASHDGVDFTLDTSAGIEPGVTAGGQLEWTGVPSGAFGIQEGIPAGYTDPIVFCGYTESPGGGVQHPARQAATGGLVEGSLPANTIFEYVCYWMNVRATGQVGTGPGSVADPGGAPGPSDLLLTKRVCPRDVALGQDLDYYQDTCTETLDGIQFTLVNEDGSSTKPVVSGSVAWTGLPLGPFTIEESIPVQYGEPVVFCGWTAIHNNLVYDDFPHLVPSPGGVVTGEISVPNTHYFCHVFNTLAGPGSYANPEALASTLVARKWTCPAGIDLDQHLSVFFRACELASSPVEFTLTNEDGDSVQATVGGKAQWDDVPLGPFTIQETIPAGYEEPFVWCGWTAFYMGAVYDAFHQPVSSGGGLVEGEISVPNTHYLCHVFNAEAEIDDFQANPTEVPAIDDIQANVTEEPGAVLPDGQGQNLIPAQVTIVEYVCEPPWDPYAQESWGWFGFLNGCSRPAGGWQAQTFEYTLTDDGGFLESVTNPLDTGANPVMVPAGAVTIVSTVPAGFGDPVTMCTGSKYSPVFNPPPAGEAQWDIGEAVTIDVALGDATLCQFFHVVEEPATNAVTVNARECKAGTASGEAFTHYLAACVDGHGGLEMTLHTWNDAESQGAVTVAGIAQFGSTALGAFWLGPDLPDDIETLAVYCGLAVAPGGEVETPMMQDLTLAGDVAGFLEAPGTEFACHWFTVAEVDGGMDGPDDFTNPEGGSGAPRR